MEQILKAFFGFPMSLAGIAIGMMTMQPEIAAGAVAKGAAEAGAAGAEIAEVMGAIVELIEALDKLEDMLDAISGVGDIDLNIPDLSGDLALGTALNWRGALENAYQMKNMTTKFEGMDILGQTKVASVGPATDGDVNPVDLQQAMSLYASNGGQLVQETVNFAQLLMKLADLAGELEVAEQDLEIAIEQVKRIIEMQSNLANQHKVYVQWMNKHRDDYQDECDEFAADYDTASAAAKEAYKEKITKLFEQFKAEFEKSNDLYIERMNDLTNSLYTKVADVKQHSMTQRAMILNLYQDYCDGLFYFSFTSCDANKDVPTMSDPFHLLLEKLNDLQWDAITSLETLPAVPVTYQEVRKVNMSCF